MSTEALDVGDEITHSISYCLKQGREEIWLKVEATTKIRHDESTEEAWYRLTDMLDARMESRINEVRDS